MALVRDMHGNGKGDYKSELLVAIISTSVGDVILYMEETS